MRIFSGTVSATNARPKGANPTAPQPLTTGNVNHEGDTHADVKTPTSPLARKPTGAATNAGFARQKPPVASVGAQQRAPPTATASNHHTVSLRGMAPTVLCSPFTTS